MALGTRNWIPNNLYGWELVWAAEVEMHEHMLDTNYRICQVEGACKSFPIKLEVVRIDTSNYNIVLYK